MIKVFNTAHRLKASSTLEITVALLLLSITLSSALWIYTKVYFSNITEKEIIAETRLQAWLIQTINDKSFVGEQYWEADIEMRKTIKFVETKRLVLIQLEAFDEQGKGLAQIKRLHYEP